MRSLETSLRGLIEIQKEVYDLAVESIKINKLDDKITIINDNMKNLDKYFEPNSFDIIAIFFLFSFSIFKYFSSILA